MKLKRRSISLILAALMLIALFAGCRSGDDTPNSSSDPVNAGEPVMGGNLNVAIPQDLDANLDPQATVSADTRQLLFNICEGLIKLNPDGTFSPAVADYYKIAESADVFTFELREGVRFHNGKEVTVDDVVYSITRAAGLDTGTPLVGELAIVKSVEATDERTVIVTLKESNYEAFAAMTVAIIPEGNDPSEELIGTGPFYFEERMPQESILIKKFADYWGEPAYLDSVTYKIIDNAEAIVTALLSGSIDLCAHLTSAQVNELGEGFNIEEGTMNLVQAIYLNNAAEPFNNVEVRRALSYAIDKQNVLDFLADGKGAKLGSSIYPNFTKYFREDLVDYYEYDVEKAKQMLADAGYPNGFEVSLTVPSNLKPHVDTAIIVAEQLKQVGVTVNVQQVDWDTWLAETYIARDYEMTIIGIDTPVLSARGMLERFTSTAGDNLINFSNDEYDEVFSRASRTQDEDEQIELYGRLQEILTEEAANLYIQDLCDLVAMQPNVGGYEFYPLYVSSMASVYFTE